MNTIISIVALIISLSTSGLARYSFDNNVISKHINTHEALTKIQVDPTNCEFGICENVPSYPRDEILASLGNMTLNPSYFGIISQPVPEIATRTGETDSLGKPLCEFKTVARTPQVMYDEDKQSRFIVNVGKYTQLLEYNICTEPGKLLTKNVVGILNRNVICEQTFMSLKLISTIPNSLKEFEFVPYSIPSACIPVIHKDAPN